MNDKVKKMGQNINKIVKEQIKDTQKEVKWDATGFQIDAEAMKDEYRLLEDFPVKPYADPYDIKDPGYQAYPINYYDNDDGFWDEYLI